MKVEVEIPDPPEGWVYDGHRSPKSGEMYWDGSMWRRLFSSPVSWKTFVAIQKPAPWQPPKELVDAILLLRGPGWLTRDQGASYCVWHAIKPVKHDIIWCSSGIEWTLCPQVPDIPWEEFCFKIGEPKQ